VVSAQFMLDSESRLQEAIQKMLVAETPMQSTASDQEMSSETMMPAEHHH